MLHIKSWIQQIVGYGKTSIRRQVLLLVLSCGFLVFLTVGLLSWYTMESTRQAVANGETVIEKSLSDSIGNFTMKRAEKWLKEAAMDAADQIDQELIDSGNNVEFLADSMSLIMSTPEYYQPRHLPSTSDPVEIVSGMPYIHYSPELVQRGIDDDLRQEIALACNIANSLAPMSKFYGEYWTSLFVASRKGYLICVDVIPDDGSGRKNVFPSEERRREFVANYDPRTRPWYIKAERERKLVHTDVYMGEDGLLDMACAVPYYDDDGFAGVVGIGSSVEDIRRYVAGETIGITGICFALDDHGHVVFSSRSDGILAMTPESTDIRETEEPSLAEAARRMVARECDTVKVVVEGNKYYLAFAPMNKIGWSFGTLIGEEEVMGPVWQTIERIHVEMEIFREILQDIFEASIAKAMLLLLPLLLVSFYASGWMAARLTKPIRKLMNGVQEIAAGNLDKKLDIRTGNEIEHLAVCFNSMTGELKAHIDSLSRAIAEKEHAQTELEVAARIQSGMLPAALKKGVYSESFDLSALMHPAKAVGGDFYDFYFVDEENLVITVADVSDKGVPAALFMVITKTLLKDQARMARSAEKLAKVVGEANDALVKSNREFMFVTAFVGMLHLPSGKFTYVNAGHNPPLVRQRGSFEYLPLAQDPILGVKGGMQFKAQHLTMAAGDAIFLYTDGVTEAMNEKHEMFTEKRLKVTLDSAVGEVSDRLRAKQILSFVEDAVHQHVGEAEQSDDITMLGFVYYGNQ